MTNTLLLNSFEFLNQYRLTAEHLQEEPNFLIPNFLAERSLSMFFAKGGSGKSYLAISMALKLLKEQSIKTVLYIDMDNSLVALKRRRLDKIIAENPDFQYIHSSRMNSSPLGLIDEVIKQGKRTPALLENALIILDSVRDFIVGRDMNSDRDVSPVMEKLKQLREAGATVIFLHHTSKEGGFKGSTAFRDSVDISYALSSERNKNQLVFTLEIDKDRLGVDGCVAFELDTETMMLESANFTMASVSDYKRQFIEKAKTIVNQYPDGITQTPLLKELGTTSDDKTARKYLKEFEGRFWTMKKLPQQNNASCYYPILPELTNLPECA
jgi:predicted ATP-dependent serine protease